MESLEPHFWQAWAKATSFALLKSFWRQTQSRLSQGASRRQYRIRFQYPGYKKGILCEKAWELPLTLLVDFRPITRRCWPIEALYCPACPSHARGIANSALCSFIHATSLSVSRFLSACVGLCANRIMSILYFFLIAFLHFASAVTLKEGLADKKKYIFYDTSPFNVGLHAGLALLITYGILGTFTPSVMIITKALEKRRKRRTRTMSH